MMFFFVETEIFAVVLTMKDQIKAFKPYIGMILSLREPAMKTQHFEELLKKTGIQMALTPTLTFKNLLVLGIMEFEDTLKTVANAARGNTQ